MKTLLSNPLFMLSLGLKLALIACVEPAAAMIWYVPFLQASVDTFSIDPWAAWINQGGTSAAFPYGYVMWLAFLPLSILCKFAGLSSMWGYGLTLLVADFTLFRLLSRMLPGRDTLLVTVYWASPIVIAASYGFGFNDLIPVTLLVLSLHCLARMRPWRAGFVCVMAMSAKLSMMIALPFFVIYLLHNRPLRGYLPIFTRGAMVGAVLTLVSFVLLSRTGVGMLMNNPEMSKVYLLAIDLGTGARIYVVPLVYLLVLYATWRVKRLNYALFSVMLGLAFLFIVLLTPASPGWFIWTVPLLVSYQIGSDRFARALCAFFSLLYVANGVFYVAPDAVMVLQDRLASLGVGSTGWRERGDSLVHTLMGGVGLVLAARIWREAIRRNDFFRLSRQPFVLGVAGDSGAGKDTYAEALTGLFGAHSVAALSGDDYHLWDRQKPMWQVMTHLNPKANDLEGFANDLVALRDGKDIQTRHYDHATGRLSRPCRIRSKDIIIASGLHALYLPMLRACYNLSVYLDIDETLRRHFKLRRDVHQRGHTMERVLSSFARREPDSARFIRPQAVHADLVLSLQPIHPRLLREPGGDVPLRFKLVTRSRHGLNEQSLVRVLVGVCGLHVDMAENGEDAAITEMIIEGEASAQDVALAARLICPRIFEFLDIQPRWQDGVMGLMQLITLSHINQALTRRFIW